jgi:hypothetical protein
MSSLGLDTTSAPAKKTDRWMTAQIVFVAAIVAFFAWNILSSGWVLVFQRSLIPTH